MSTEEKRGRAPGEAAVRPRRVWLAVLCCLAGIVLLGAGVMTLAWWPVLLGAAALVAGSVLGYMGGWARDVHAARPARKELHEIASGGAHRGVRPGQMVHDQEAQEVSAAVEERRRQLLARAGRARAPLAELGAGLLLVVGAVLLVAQWSLYPHTATGQANGLHALGVGIVSALAGLRVLTGRGEPHPLAGAVGALAGAILLVLAWTAPHSGNGIPVFETVCAVAVLAGSAAGLSWREQPNDDRS